MSKLWQQTSGNERQPTGLADRAEAFTVGEDYRLDQQLIPYDVQASRVHARGLHRIGLLDDEELEALLDGLDAVLERWSAGEFPISRRQEDGHTAIEQFLTAQLGAAGRKIHAGRSRNDQVLVAMRLYEREQLEQVTRQVKTLAGLFLDRAGQYAEVPMPGYTHTQRAMLSSVGMWLGAVAEMLVMDLEGLRAVYRNVNRCPLGTAAGFGVNLDLPRDWVAQELGFDTPVTVALTAQNTRARIDLQLVQALDAVGGTLAHFANDLVEYSGSEYGFFQVDPALCTGSSIMPQKQNVDTAELLRGRSAVLSGCVQTLRSLTSGLKSGYHRDLQLAKPQVMKAFRELSEMLDMAGLLVEHITPDEERLAAACTSELFAAHRANELVKEGLSFREAYHRIKQNLGQLQSGDLKARLREMKHLGATGNPGLERLREEMKAFQLGRF